MGAAGTSGSVNSGGIAAAGAVAGGSGGDDAASDTNALLPLPTGSRELDGVVNLVDSSAAKELDDFIVTEYGIRNLLDIHDLTTTLNLFLEHYEEQYDFVYFLTDHPLPQTSFIGKFEAVSRPAQVGTGNNLQIAADGYETNGRVKGVIGVQYIAGGYGPFAHEMAHYWANYLDPAFGIGAGLTHQDAGHWGYSSVHGELGGFDLASLVCKTPSGAPPSVCSPLPSGKIDYLVDPFAPNVNGPNAPYAPFELYLMGLAPIAAAPPQITVLTDAVMPANSLDPSTGKVVVEASGMKAVNLSDIVARHGQVTELPTKDKAFSAVFVVISATPVPDALLAEVANWSAFFGDRKTDPELKSFASLTGGRATLDTKLGPRRTTTEAPPAIRAPLSCSVLKQDCQGPAGMIGCYLDGQSTLCAVSRGVQRDQPCTESMDCVVGAECLISSTSQKLLCEPYCDPTDMTSPVACAKLCPKYITLADPEGHVITGRCLAP
jgi:hypothetical protein